MLFDTYMDAHDLDPHLRRRMTLALGAAAVTSALAIVGYTGAEKLSITRVGAPQVELDFVLANSVVSPMSVPPPPSPRQTAAASAAATEPDPEPRTSATEPATEDVLDTPRPRLGTVQGSDHGRTGVPGVPGVPGQIPGPAATGGVPCIGPTCTTGAPPRVVPPRVMPPSDTAKVPLDVARGRLRYSPDPPREALLATRAGSLRRGGTSVVEFCVGTDGKVDRVTTKRSAGDGDVDRICRDTLRRWRFSPLEVQGRATRMCSEFAFVIAFE